MPTFRFEKLVRDKIVAKQIESGAEVVSRHLNPDEHKQALIKKIIEEAGEIADAAPDEVIAEIADVQQALDDLIAVSGFTREEVHQAQVAKNDKNGSFSRGQYIESIEIAEEDPWTTYYRENSDRYPEVE